MRTTPYGGRDAHRPAARAIMLGEGPPRPPATQPCVHPDKTSNLQSVLAGWRAVFQSCDIGAMSTVGRVSGRRMQVHTELAAIARVQFNEFGESGFDGHNVPSFHSPPSVAVLSTYRMNIGGRRHPARAC